MINLNYLRSFYICAQSGSFTQAAIQLHTSQPSLSTQIKSFEKQLRFQLFIRSGRSIQLTPKGQNLFLTASKIFEMTDDIEKNLIDHPTNLNNQLKIGVSDEVERPFIADIVGRFIKANRTRKIIPSIISKKHSEMVRSVLNKEIDLIVTNEKNSQLKLMCQLSLPVALISANFDSALKGQQQLTNLLKAIDQGLILPTDEMILARETKRFLRNKNLSRSTILTSNIIACITRAVQEKLGAAFLPISYVQREIKAGTLQAYGPKNGYWQHHLYLYSYKGNTNQFALSLSKILQDFSVLKFDPEFAT